MVENFSSRMRDIKKSFIREILKAIDKPGMISFAGGLPNPLSFPVDEIAEATKKVLSTDGRNVLQYSTTEGYLPLREFIAQRYKARFGFDADPQDIIITNGSQQALDLTAKVFIDKGDAVAIERPGYLGAIQALSIYEPRFFDAELNDDGINVPQLKKIIEEEKPKLFYSVPNFQNPSGISYSGKVREEVADIITNSGTYLIEDDPYGELRFMGRDEPSFRQIAGDKVIVLGSFSKIVSPGIRLGWVYAGKEIINNIVTAKQASDLHSNYFVQRVVCQYLQDNDIEKHIAKIKVLYKEQRDCMVEMIEKYFPEEVTTTKPSGGMFLWATLPEGVSSFDIFEKAYENNVAFVPGSPFYANRVCENTMRLNYSNSSNDAIEEGIRKLGKIIKDHLAEGK